MLFYTFNLDEVQKNKFERIYDQYHKLMFCIAYEMLNDEMDSEDAVHMAFIKILNHLDGINMNERVMTKTFIHMIVKSCCIDILRKSQKGNLVSWDDLGEWEIPYVNPIEFIDIPEENKVLIGIKKMPFLYREILIMKYVHGYDNETLAKMFGINEASVRQRISRGKKMLEKILNGEDKNDYQNNG